MDLYIIRHAQSENNALMQDQHLRVKDPDLTEVGVQQANLLAQYLKENNNIDDLVRKKIDDPARAERHPHKITHLYCSAMKRALKTAQPIGEALGLNAEVWVDIHEHGGIFLEEPEGVITGYGGMTRSEILELYPNYVLPKIITEAGWWNPANGKEDVPGCHARAIRTAQMLWERARHADTKDDVVAIVTHGFFIDCLLKALWNSSPGTGHFHWLYNTSVTRVDFVTESPRFGDFVGMRCINRVAHLPEELIT